MNLYLIVDYRGKFYTSVKYWDASVQLDILKDLFKEDDYDLILVSYPEVAFDINKYKNQYVLYQSSEDRGLLYKDYIEDIILALKLAGAIVIPDYPMLRAHHNKCFMELMRKIFNNESIDNIQSYVFGTKEEFLNYYPNISDNKWVLKPASGARSNRVKLAVTNKNLLKWGKKLSSSFNIIDFLKTTVKHLLKSRFMNYKRKSLNRKKFVIQKYIDGLTGDYKILIFNQKYYVLYRNNRKNDFRASGSGIFDINPIVSPEMLDFCKLIYNTFNVPYISLDVAHLYDKFYLLEFQFLMFGTYTLEKSDGYYRLNCGIWEKVKEEPFLEREIATSISHFINNKINRLS